MKKLVFISALVSTLAFAGVESYRFVASGVVGTTTVTDADRARQCIGIATNLSVATETNVTVRVVTVQGAGLSLAGSRTILDWTTLDQNGTNMAVSTGILLAGDIVKMQLTNSASASQVVRATLGTVH